jgi:hypothetical protein
MAPNCPLSFLLFQQPATVVLALHAHADTHLIIQKHITHSGTNSKPKPNPDDEAEKNQLEILIFML